MVARTGTTTFAGGGVSKITINPIAERAFFKKEYVVTLYMDFKKRLMDLGLFSQKLRGCLMAAYNYFEGDS